VALDELVQNSDSLAALLVLEDKEVQAIAQAFNVRTFAFSLLALISLYFASLIQNRIAETEDPLRAAYQKAVRPLQSQKGYDRLPSLTGRVKILGDNPVTQGPWYELFHGETANGNRVMVRLWRPTDNRRHAREVRNLASFSRIENFLSLFTCNSECDVFLARQHFGRA
jgi:hypothetical protein